MSCMIGVDVGGTFTDISLLDIETGVIKIHKVPSTPDDPSRAIMTGVDEILQINNLPYSDVQYLAHGTTVATNALIERKGAKTGLLVTKGFKDLLEIGRQTRSSLYSLFIKKPEPLIPGNLRLEIDERLYSDGSCRKAVDKGDVSKRINELKDNSVTSIAVCFLFSYLNPEHEKQVLSQLKEEYPGVYISASHEVVPEFREYDRISTTVINAYLGPVMKRYMENFKSSVKQRKIGISPYIMQSNGGIISIGESVQNPVRTAMSGPAAGVVAASYLSERTGFKNMITFDMGGTSADFSLIENGTPKISIERTIEEFPARIPMLDIHTCGAGGGSIAWLDAGGALKVGPESAGAVPGPACYSRGGMLPTVTDANTVLGRLNPQNMLGGRMTLDVAASKKAIQSYICDHSSLSLMEAACGIISVVNATMTRAIRVISVEKGYDPREFTLVSFGGGGGLHCCALAKELNIPNILIPPAPGTFCSLGLLVSDVRSDYVRSMLLEAKADELSTIGGLFSQMRKEGEEFLIKENIPAKDCRYDCTIDMRFVGQNYELTIPVDMSELRADRFDSIIRRFHDEHRKKYGYSDKKAVVEFVNYRLTAIGILSKPEFKKLGSYSDKTPVATGHRDVYYSDVDKPGLYDTFIYNRTDLLPGNRLAGPAIIEQMDSTIMILPGQTADIDPYGDIIIHTFGEVE
ncbi:MAG: hydantoinase/oxoprolinase family protein [Clostridiaceae bacterium]